MLSAVLVFALVVPPFVIPDTCVWSLPPNLDGGALTRDAVRLLQRSPTFRQQCVRIASTPRARIRIELGTPGERTSRAETRLERFQAGAIRATITIRFLETYPEMLAHELEHVMELIEGLSFSAEYHAGRAWVTAAGAFETARARLAGARVQEEFDASAPHGASRARDARPGRQ